MKKNLKKTFMYLTVIGSLVLLFVIVCNKWIVNSTIDKLFSDVDKLPNNSVGLVLGANPIMQGKYRNPYFDNRITAAVELYKKGKVKHLLVSGDNHKHGYNEPEEMQKALMAKGVPESAITLDFAGFRTLDSVVRSKKVFQQNKITILSQRFHNHRAIFIANRYGMDAVAFNAADAFPGVNSKSDWREYLARCKAILDLYILRKKPKFLGDKIDIII